MSSRSGREPSPRQQGRRAGCESEPSRAAAPAPGTLPGDSRAHGHDPHRTAAPAGAEGVAGCGNLFF